MGSHPINLGIRFLLEIAALIILGIWGWRKGDGWLQYVFAIGIPVLLAVIWGIFAVPDDPSRSGAAPVPTMGIIRLVIELGIFAFATWSLFDMGYQKWGLILGIIVILHYGFSYDRILWLIQR